MKKILMTLAAAVVAVSASAQVYLGGNFGIASTKIAGGDDKTTYKLLPEIGYSLNEDWAIGTVVGWGKGNPVEIEDGDRAVGTFEVNPYARYTFFHSNMINAFVDGGFGYKHYNGVGNEWSVGLKPGVAVNVNKFSFVAHVGFVGWKQQKASYDGAKANSAWGVDFNGNNVTFGLYYNF